VIGIANGSHEWSDTDDHIEALGIAIAAAIAVGGLVKIDLVDANHQVVDSASVTFDVPARVGARPPL
jgi:hypothetical protein